MRIVITGAFGYIGAALLRAGDLSRTDELILIDDRSRGQASVAADLRPERPFRVIDDDIRAIDFDAIIEPGDRVIHLAALTGADAAASSASLLEEINVTATARIARACARRRASLLFVSSTSVYGALDGSVDERSAIDESGLESPYARSKWRAEECLRAIAAETGVRATIARCGTIYGPSPAWRPHTAINRFCWQAAIGAPLTVWRTALHQRRPYLDIDDAVRAIQFLASGSHHGTYNVATETATVADVIAMLRECEPDLRTEQVDSVLMTPRSQDVSTARLRAAGVVIHGGLRSGIARMMAALQTVRAARQFHRVP